MTVVFVTASTPLRACHLLYISAVTMVQANAALVTVRGAPTLTMVDIDNFAAQHHRAGVRRRRHGVTSTSTSGCQAIQARYQLAGAATGVQGLSGTDSFGPLP